MEKAFHDLLEIIRDEDRPFPFERLAELSDLDKHHTAQLHEMWPHFPETRKRILLATLGQQAFEHIELTFEPINRLALFDSDAEVRSIAIQNLWECEDPTLAKPLLNALNEDGEAHVRAVAATALGLFVWLGEIEELPADLLRLIEEGLLRAAVQDEASEVRRRSLESLGFSSRSEVPRLIENAYQTEEESSKQSALFAMGRSASDLWKPHVLAELFHASPKIRLEAARAAGELEINEAIENLIDLLQDIDEGVRDTAIWALAELGGEDAKEALVDILRTAEDEAFLTYVSEALDHMAFIDGTRDLLMFDFDEFEDPEEHLH
ncbi:MAG: hypothetical protein GTO14_14855 [Anaerolineales bacterium]|nr:hypothetical protein [Anaerolineales bacterium]